MKKRMVGMVLVICLLVSLMPVQAYAVGSMEPALNGKTFSIGTAAELVWLSEQVAAGNHFSGYTFELTADIDLEGAGWSSIGYNLNNYFAGTFDGKNHTIRNFSASGSVDAFSIVNAPRHTVGLFGVCIGAVVKHLVIENAAFSISNESGYQNSYSSIDGTCTYGGIVCGYASQSQFSNIIVRDSEVVVYTGAEAAYAYAGGIAGYAKACDFAHCGVENSTVQATTESLNNDAAAGGIAGELVNSGTVRQCYNASSVYGGSAVSGAYTGGIIGKSSNTESTLSSIRDCYNQGQVYHKGSWLDNAYVGGIIGYSSSTVNRCYNAGIVYADTDTMGSALLGGIAGSGISTSTVTNSAVMSSKISGGTSNYIIAGAGTKENNVACNGLSGTNDATSKVADSQFRTKPIFEETLLWNFSHIWTQTEGEYPVLQYHDADTEYDMIIADEAAEAIQIIFADGDSYDQVTQNMTFTESPNTATVVWSSSNEDVVSTAGVVSRKEEEHLIRVIATISSGDYSVQKRFLLNVVPTSVTPEVEIVDVAMSLDEARTFVSKMRGCRFKDVSVNDPDVLVLIGADVTDEQIADSMVRLMQYMEIPGESQYLKEKMGDVIQLIHDGEDAAVNEVLGKLKYEIAGGIPELGGARKLVKTCFATADAGKKIVAGYDYVLNHTTADPVDTLLSPAFSAITAVEKVFECILEPSGYAGLSKVMKRVNFLMSFVELYGAYKTEQQNAVKAYLSMYLKNRPRFDSAEDETFKLIMATANITNCIDNEDELNTTAEYLYELNIKFGGNVEDKYKVTIQCPVDVLVYDSQGKIVGRVTDNVVDGTILNSLLITVGGENNDEKTIHFPDDEAYTIKLVGNDTGEMTVLVEDQSEGTTVTYDYSNIELTNGKTMSLDVSTEMLNESELPAIYDVENGIEVSEGKEADAAQKQYALTVYPYLEDGDGNLTASVLGGYCGSEYVAEGTVLESLIVVNSGYLFSGFYKDPECTQPYTETQMPRSELTLYAKFSANLSGITILEHPQNADYYVDDPAQALTVSIEEDVDVTYQWYVYSDTKENASAVEGATSAECMPDTATEAEVYYFVRISCKSGEETVSIDSNAALIRVRKKLILGSGTCGDDLQWVLDVEGVLTISGTGTMADYSKNAAPWYALSSEIVEVVVEEGASSIGQNAFANLTALKAVTLPKSVELIAEGTFTGCSALERMKLPFVGTSSAATGENGVLGSLFGKVSAGGVVQYHEMDGTSLSGYRYGIPGTLKEISITDATAIPFGAFYNCTTLTQITLNDGLKSIGAYSFCNCSALRELTIPDSVTLIEEYALKDCQSLNKISIPFVGVSAERNNSYDAVFGIIFGRASEGILQYGILEGNSLSGYYYAIPSALTKVVVTNETEIPLGAFSNCTSVAEVRLNSEVNAVNLYAFYNCTSLKKIQFTGDAPQIDGSAFTSVVSDAYYPTGNVTWTSDVMQNYGGTLTWIAHVHVWDEGVVTTEPTCTESGIRTFTCTDGCGETKTESIESIGHVYENGICTGCGVEEPAPAPVVKAKNATLTLEDEVSINIYFTVENMTADTANMGLLAWDEKPATPAYDNAEYRFGGVSLEGERYKVTTDPIAAKNMGDSRYYMTYVKQDDGSYVYSQLFTYSPLKYVENKLTKVAEGTTPGLGDLEALCVALLNYGAEAQKYFASTTDYTYTTLMNADLTDEQKAYVEAYREDMVPAVVPADASKVGSFTATANSFTSKKATVTLGGALAVNFYLKPSVSTDGMTMYYWSATDYAEASVLTAENATGTYEMELLSDGRYLASVENISAKNMADTVYVCGVYEVDGVTHSTGVIAYSIGKYCVNKAAAASDVQALAQATAVYGYYAKEYFNK